MKVTKEKLPKSLLALDIEIDKARVEKGLDRAARRLSQNHMIPGFRKGKAPRFIVERMFGRDALVEEASEDLINKALQEVVEQEQIKLMGKAHLEHMDFDETFKFRVTVPVPPTVKLPDYRSYRFPLEMEPVTEERIQRVMEMLRDKHGFLQELDDPRPAQQGDNLTVKLIVLDEKGQNISEPLSDEADEEDTDEDFDEVDEDFDEDEDEDEDTNENFDEDNEDNEDEQEERENLDEASESNLVLEPERLLREVYQELLGAQVGDYREINARIPDDHSDEKMRGKDVTFKIKVINIQERILHDWEEIPELENFGGSLDELRERKRAELIAKEESEAREELISNFMERLVSETEYDIPDVMISEAIENMVEEQKRYLSRYGVNIEEVLKLQGKTLDDVKEEFRPEAEKSVRESLAFVELGVDMKISYSERDLMAEILTIVGQYPDEQKEQVMNELSGQAHQYVVNRMLDRAIRENIVAIATGQELEHEHEHGHEHGHGHGHEHEHGHGHGHEHEHGHGQDVGTDDAPASDTSQQEQETGDIQQSTDPSLEEQQR